MRHQLEQLPGLRVEQMGVVGEEQRRAPGRPEQGHDGERERDLTCAGITARHDRCQEVTLRSRHLRQHVGQRCEESLQAGPGQRTFVGVTGHCQHHPAGPGMRIAGHRQPGPAGVAVHRRPSFATPTGKTLTDTTLTDTTLTDATLTDATPIDATPIDATPIDATPIDATPTDGQRCSMQQRGAALACRAHEDQGAAPPRCGRIQQRPHGR
ncbi:hypothetical protein [Paractinoplanes rishiriensis]|uniref:Uncharacterized protein n=1 Tax=Paractinoplanes rishiriensis TaxID=1050105 RepID=A0A919MW97_9ACTN|nr:hypothetical protein [Actinoplanes rishiriensis]GIE97239.1 hypothetical protein Ari01nite_47040 [Actinoplanes rishiriensis]